MIFPANSKIVMIGDSITDANRARPCGEGLFDALGQGFVRDMNSLLQSGYPELRLRVVNMGCSGNTIRDLDARWQTDVLDQKADFVAIMIGINDVWRQFDSPFLHEQHVLLDEYEETLDRLVQSALDGGSRVILQTPFIIEEQKADRMRVTMDGYGAAVKRVALKHGCLAVDTQACFDRFLEHHHSSYLAWDRIHPTPVGTMILARAFLEVIGFAWKNTP